MCIRHNSILNLIKYGETFFCVDIMYITYLDVKYFLVVCLSIYYEKPVEKTTLITTGYFFAKKLNYCPFDIICNSIALKCQCLKHTLECLIHAFCISNKSWQEISSAPFDLGN